jgi:hypothetical protein
MSPGAQWLDRPLPPPPTPEGHSSSGPGCPMGAKQGRFGSGLRAAFSGEMSCITTSAAVGLTALGGLGLGVGLMGLQPS